MTLRLDPRWPLVWRDPFTLQIGVDPAVVVMPQVDALEEKVVAALTVGVPRRGLDVLTAAEPQRLDALLERLRPALLTSSPRSAAARVTVSGTGRLAGAVRGLVRDAGHEVLSADAEEAPDLAVVVGHWVLPPETHSYWLRRDIPHLPVVATDGAVHVGPLIEPGDGPCLLCLELHRRDDDDAWPAIATQLLGRAPGSEHPALVADAAAAAARAIEFRVDHGPGAARSVRIDAAGGRETRDWAPHPECGCRGIAHLVAVATDRTGSDSPGAGIAPVRRLPTTARDGAWPA